MQPQAPANPLGTAPIKSLIWKYAIPGIITQLVSALHNIVDQVFVGWGIGDNGIAATNIVFPLTSVIIALSTLLGIGAAARFSILLGKGEQEGAAKVIGTSIGWMVLLGAAASIITSVFMEPMLYLFGATELIMPYAAPYARLICIGLFFGILSSGLSYFIRADGSPKFASYVLVAGAVFNMVFDPLFLFVFDMGMTGIALATLLGQLLSTILALYYMFKRFHSVTLSPRHLRPRMAETGTIFSLGIAVFTTHVLAMIAQIIQMNGLKTYGALTVYGSEVTIAAAGAVGKITIVLLSSVIGIALGCQPIYGFNLGRKQYGRVRETYLTVLRYGTIISVAAFLLVQIFPRQILRMFGSDNELFYSFGAHYIHIFFACLFLNALQPITSNFCTAMGKANRAFWLAVLRQGILLIPLLLLLPRFLGIDGVLLSGAISDGLTAIVVLWVGLREAKNLSKLEAAQAQATGEAP
ncbi:MAG: MATE family efflux transporter [Ruminiclostridium sp.]|jgi:putative MATE family efflux protein|nr:MATE family efflux transporter [Ruminiclostridium sp.]MCI9466954.1 MATE family efflux transporter [Ruminiclostridium sp.]